MNVRNLAAYLGERFPPVNMMLFAILFLTVYSVSSYFNADQDTGSTGLIVLGAVATISFFFRLRVFDEIKDYAIDSVNHPQRVLQSGRISLRQLMVVSILLSITEVVWSVLSGWTTVVCWGAALAYSLLMRYEFFGGAYLKRRLFLYAFTHMLIMPWVILWIWSAFYKGEGLSQGLTLLAVLSLLGGFSFELARKIHAAAAERETVDSYSRSVGYTASIVLVLLFLLSGVAVQALLLSLLGARTWTYAVLGVLYVVTLFFYVQALRRPDEKQLRQSELFVSLFMLVSYLSLIIEVQFK